MKNILAGYQSDGRLEEALLAKLLEHIVLRYNNKVKQNLIFQNK